MNYAKTTLLMAAMTGLFLAIGFLMGGEGGMLIALLIAAAMNLFAYWNSGNLMLRMQNARPVSAQNAPELLDLVEQLAGNANLPMPDVYIVETAQPNAFATGRNPENAAIAVTSGLLRILNRQELAGVIAHELAHIRNRDTLIMTVTATIAGAIGMIANFAMFFGNNRNNSLGMVGSLLVMILAPLAASLVQMAISRAREFEADRAAAHICGHPMWLASALAKLEHGAMHSLNRRAEANPAQAHLFIVNPLRAGRFGALFRTHPRIEDRIARLQAMAPPRPQTSVSNHLPGRSRTGSTSS